MEVTTYRPASAGPSFFSFSIPSRPETLVQGEKRLMPRAFLNANGDFERLGFLSQKN